jgi:tetratricopeptide repeat protein 8
MTLSCFEKALALANDDNMADVWFNIGQVAIGLGDLNLAYQALKVAISVDSAHSEAFNNIGVLELRKGAVEQAKANFLSAATLSPLSFEPLFNSALLSFKLGDCQESFESVTKSIAAYGEHADSHELLKQLKKHFAHL